MDRLKKSKDNHENQKMKFDTLAVHAGSKPDPTTGAIVPPIYQTATYVLDEVGRDKGFDYSRASNPTRQALEEALAALEGGEFAVAFSSGLSAVDAVFRMLKPGDHILASEDLYGGVIRLLDNFFDPYGFDVTYVDTTDPDLIDKAFQSNTKMLWIETPSNPLLRITDLDAMAQLAKKHDVLYAVDPTFATPALLRPLEYGVDIIVQSTTKYLSGHNQVIGGAVIVNDETLFEKLKFTQKAVGAVPGPMDCFLTQMGLKTLSLRMERHSSNGMKVAKFLNDHPSVSRVSYPGLSSHPQHKIAKTQMSGFGGMVSFELKGGTEAGIKLMNKVKLCALAESLGAVETMVTHPVSMTHADIPKEVREARGLTDGFVRISVGIEDVEDIIEDIARALD